MASLSTIGFNGGVREFEFVNDSIGYALLGNNVGGGVEVFKTIDGGKLWSDLEISSSQFPQGMTFRNEQIGIITVHDVTGCPPPNCENRTVVLLTDDGGATWEERIVAGFNGRLSHPTYDAECNLYALLSLDTEHSILKSTDDGRTWEVHFESPEIEYRLVTFGFTIAAGEFYVGGSNGTLLVVNREGELDRILEYEDAPLWDLEVIDPETIVIATSGQLIKTIDGGTTWKVISDESARIIGFNSADRGTVLLRKSDCPGDVYQVNDVLAVTYDGADSWIEPEETTTNLRLDFQDRFQMPNGDWYVMVDNELLATRF